jgi:hypothetical protein
MNNNTTNQVRQVLMNELGLTREFIREETAKLVTETVEKKFKGMDVDKMISDAVAIKISKVYSMSGFYSGGDFNRAVMLQVEAQVKNHVMKNLPVSINGVIEIKTENKDDQAVSK